MSTMIRSIHRVHERLPAPRRDRPLALLFNDFIEDEEANSHVTSDCMFCEDESAGPTIAETPNFRLKLDIAPLVEGHLLLYTKEHIGCAGELRSHLLDEYVALRNLIKRMMADVYGRVAFYEHGRAGHCMTLAEDQSGCHHFHMHALPLPLSIRDGLSERFELFELGSPEKIVDAYSRYGAYLYFEDSAGKAVFAPASDSIEPHLLRTMIANGLGKPERAAWQDWTDRATQMRAASEFRKYLAAASGRSRETLRLVPA